jgi:hypothetical protein
MRMNGELVEGALSGAQGTYLHEVLTERSSEAEKIRKLCLATLSRHPTPQEMAALRRLLRERSAPRGPQTGNRQTAESLKDVFWAYLNSGEFVLIH